jgi:hypothetical protein
MAWRRRDCGRLPASYFIAMEYVHGVSLAALFACLSERRLRLRPTLCVWFASALSAIVFKPNGKRVRRRGWRPAATSAASTSWLDAQAHSAGAGRGASGWLSAWARANASSCLHSPSTRSSVSKLSRTTPKRRA